MLGARGQEAGAPQDETRRKHTRGSGNRSTGIKSTGKWRFEAGEAKPGNEWGEGRKEVMEEENNK